MPANIAILHRYKCTCLNTQGVMNFVNFFSARIAVACCSFDLLAMTDQILCCMQISTTLKEITSQID